MQLWQRFSWIWVSAHTLFKTVLVFICLKLNNVGHIVFARFFLQIIVTASKYWQGVTFSNFFQTNLYFEQETRKNKKQVPLKLSLFCFCSYAKFYCVGHFIILSSP